MDSCFKTFGCGSAIASSSVATEWWACHYSSSANWLACAHLLPSNASLAIVQGVQSLPAAPQLQILPSHQQAFMPLLAVASTQVPFDLLCCLCRVKGRSVNEVLTIKNSDIAKHLSLPPVKLHCSMLAEDAIKAAVKDIQAKRAKAGSTQPAEELQAATA